MTNLLASISVQDVLTALNSTGMIGLIIGGIKIYKTQKNNGGAKTTALLNDINGKMNVLLTRLDGYEERCKTHMANQARELDGVKDRLETHDEQIFKIVAG
jgi:hypothetical protein